MRRLDTETVYSKRTYFFGVIGFITFLVQRGLMSVEHMTGTTVPPVLLTVVTILLFTIAILAVYNTVKSFKEPSSFKKTIGLIAAVGCVYYVVSYWVL